MTTHLDLAVEILQRRIISMRESLTKALGKEKKEMYEEAIRQCKKLIKLAEEYMEKEGK